MYQFKYNLNNIHTFIIRSVKPIHRFLRGWDVSDTLPLGQSILWIVVLTYGLFGKWKVEGYNGSGNECGPYHFQRPLP